MPLYDLSYVCLIELFCYLFFVLFFFDCSSEGVFKLSKIKQKDIYKNSCQKKKRDCIHYILKGVTG